MSASPLPVEGDGPIWATLDVRPNLAGRALSALSRSPTVRLVATLDDGTRATLWRACLGPGEGSGRAVLDVPDG